MCKDSRSFLEMVMACRGGGSKCGMAALQAAHPDSCRICPILHCTFLHIFDPTLEFSNVSGSCFGRHQPFSSVGGKDIGLERGSVGVRFLHHHLAHVGQTLTPMGFSWCFNLQVSLRPPGRVSCRFPSPSLWSNPTLKRGMD